MAAPAAGRTSQHAGAYGTQRLPSNAVSFSLVGGKVARFSIPWVVGCQTVVGNRHTSSVLDRILIVDALPLRGGRFVADGHYSFPPGPDQKAEVSFTLRGTVQHGRASGTLVVGTNITLNQSYPAEFCNRPRTIRWHAVAGRRARSLAAPARSRPRTYLAGIVFYARTDPAGGPTAIFRTTADGARRTTQVTHPSAGVADGAPALPETPGFLAYRRVAGGVGQIHLADPNDAFQPEAPFPDGRGTDFAQGAGDPAVRPDWRLAFSVGHGADCTIWLMDRDGTHLRRLTDHGGAPGCDDAPAWSPDGKRLAFRRTVTDAAGSPRAISVLVVSAAGGTPRPLPFGGDVPRAFNWAPGRKIAYVADDRGSPFPRPACDQRRRHRPQDPVEFAAPGRPAAWAPLRDRIARLVRRDDGSTDIATVPAAGGEPTDITSTPGISEDSPAWSFPIPEGLGGGAPGPQRPRQVTERAAPQAAPPPDVIELHGGHSPWKDRAPHCP